MQKECLMYFDKLSCIDAFKLMKHENHSNEPHPPPSVQIEVGNTTVCFSKIALKVHIAETMLI